MSTDQRASERVGELIQNAFESLLQVNTYLERLQDLIGLGMDLEQLLAPHTQATWKFMVPQGERLRENWTKFISAVEGTNSSAAPSIQPAVVMAATVERAPAPFPSITVPVTEKVTPAIQVEETHEPEPEPEPPRQAPTPPAPATPTPAAIKEEPSQPQSLPPGCSVQNPMNIDESDDDEVLIARFAVAAKRRMKVPPPDGETPGKRSKSASAQPPLSKDPGPAPTMIVLKSHKKRSLSAKYLWKPHKDADVESYGPDQSFLHKRLDQLGPPLHVDRSRITHDEFIITRMDITNIYGGENISSFPRIGKKGKGKHPYRNFLHGNFDHNPFLPPEPGWPGLFFRLDEINDHKDVDGNPIVYRTFARHSDRRCVYLGQYTLSKLEDISKEEWRNLPDKTQMIWLKFFGPTLLANRSLARIALRLSQGKEPTEVQVLEKCGSLRAKIIRQPLAEKLQTEIRRAFSQGKERIVVWGMKCVSYDYEFEVDLATKWQEHAGNAHKEDRVPKHGSRGHLSRRAKLPSWAFQQEDTVSVTSSSVESSEDEESLLSVDDSPKCSLAERMC